MKRVLILIKGLGRGGAEQLLLNAARHVGGNFHYEVAYLLPWKDALVGELQAEGLTVTCLDAKRGPGWIGGLRSLVAERRIDLVHAHLPFSAIGARVGLRGPGRPKIVYTEHNMWKRYNKLTYWGNLLTYPRNDHVFAVSDHVRGSIKYPHAVSRLRMPPVETLYHGADLKAHSMDVDTAAVRHELGIPLDAPVVGTVANFKPHKGHKYLLDAVVRVRESVPEARFVLVGLGPLEDEIRAQAARLGLNGSVIFAGFRTDALRVASCFDVFTLPSLHEGLSIALVEAMALGKPSVVTIAGGLPEAIDDGVEGFLVPPRRPDALADSLVKVLTDRDLRTQMGRAAKIRAGDFDMTKTVGRMEQVYEDLLR